MKANGSNRVGWNARGTQSPRLDLLDAQVQESIDKIKAHQACAELMDVLGEGDYLNWLDDLDPDSITWHEIRVAAEARLAQEEHILAIYWGDPRRELEAVQ